MKTTQLSNLGLTRIGHCCSDFND